MSIVMKNGPGMNRLIGRGAGKTGWVFFGRNGQIVASRAAD
jgi:hypothetical protein